MLGKAILIFFVFGAGVLFGTMLMAVLSANSREEERDKAYIMGFKDCMHGKKPKVWIR